VPRTGTRPTSDRVRESLFNVLASRIDFAGSSVLDLYAGSGALGLEAMSRGATSAAFVESDSRAAAVLAKNIASLGVTAAVRRGPVAAVLAGGTGRPVDLVFADPPYDLPVVDLEQMLVALDSGGWVSDGTVVVVERAASGPELAWPDGWEPWPSRRYGDTRIELARRQSA
jgi:16S rRNA (guanine(966)-N(2))-methyltransferase RsmD